MFKLFGCVHMVKVMHLDLMTHGIRVVTDNLHDLTRPVSSVTRDGVTDPAAVNHP